jgi:hypothetical protein
MAEFYCTLSTWYRMVNGCILSVGDFGLWFDSTENGNVIWVMTWDYDQECLVVP